MTARPAAGLAVEAADLRSAIELLGTPGAPAGAARRGELEQRVLRLCAAAQALAPVEAHSFADTLAGLVAALDAAADRLRAAGAGGGDSTPAPTTHRRAATAYGSPGGRRRGGF